MDENVSTRQSSITVAIRVRPFNEWEKLHLIQDDNDESDQEQDDHGSRTSSRDSIASVKYSTNTNIMKPNGVWKLVDCVDDKMLIFDPSNKNPLNKLSSNILNSMGNNDSNNKPGSNNNSNSNSMRRRNNRRNRHSTFYGSSPNSAQSSEIRFIFDKLFDTNSTQERVYNDTMTPLLDSVMDGYNGTIFAYGATGCGKTYTITGVPEDPGIIFRTMSDLFHRVDSLQEEREFKISISFLEIYNETIRDLLKPDTPAKKLIIREDSNSKITVANLSYHYPTNVDETLSLIARGNLHRTTSPTEANVVSSRSHAVLQVSIVQTNKLIDLKSKHTFGTLSIIDLAGSERAAATKNRGQRLHEGANINRSLLALGNCINALCSMDISNNGNNVGRRRVTHVPYRDSKLTRLLKFSLGGNCKTVMIVCISPSSKHYDETLNTLKYANRAKEIKTKIIRNQQSLNRHVGSYLKMITEQKQMIEKLQIRENEIIQETQNRYRVNEMIINNSIEQVINNLKYQITSDDNSRLHKYQNIKSLMLVKRRFLQLIQLEVEQVLLINEDYGWKDPMISSVCSERIAWIKKEILNLETQFDQDKTKNVNDNDNDIEGIELLINNSRSRDLVKLRELNQWDDSIHLIRYEESMEMIRQFFTQQILIQSSQMMEELLRDSLMIQKFQFLSKIIVNEDMNILNELNQLNEINETFDQFASQYLQDRNGSSGSANSNNINESDINGIRQEFVSSNDYSYKINNNNNNNNNNNTRHIIDSNNGNDNKISTESQQDSKINSGIPMIKEIQHAPLNNSESVTNNTMDISMQDVTMMKDDEDEINYETTTTSSLGVNNYNYQTSLMKNRGNGNHNNNRNRNGRISLISLNIPPQKE